MYILGARATLIHTAIAAARATLEPAWLNIGLCRWWWWWWRRRQRKHRLWFQGGGNQASMPQSMTQSRREWWASAVAPKQRA
jgi:hypothetical protein